LTQKELQARLGTESGETRIATPIDITNLAGLRVTLIAADSAHSLLLAVPEPGSFTLLTPAFFALVNLRRRERWTRATEGRRRV
jgi:hypothetical protein